MRQKCKTSKIVTYKMVKKAVCEYFDITEEELLAKSRKQDAVIRRQIGIFLSLRYVDYGSLKGAAEAFGYTDHSTAVHSKEQIINYLTGPDRMFAESVRRDLYAVRARLKIVGEDIESFIDLLPKPHKFTPENETGYFVTTLSF